MTRGYRWNKLGLVFSPDTQYAWMTTHASVPTPLHLEGSIYRIYFSSRDENGRSNIGFFDIDLTDPRNILEVSRKPVLSPGPLGFFDDHGIYASCAVRHDRDIYLYTIGWNPGPRAPLFYSSIGLAISTDGGASFEKYGVSPIMARSDHDPCLVTAPMVIKAAENWRMWYVSGIEWREIDGELRSTYHIKYAESLDGIDWQRDGRICIDHENEGETNISRTCVVTTQNGYQAWYSYSSGCGYRIGCAESSDGLSWTREDDRAGIEPSADGWDSLAQAYPYVVSYGVQMFMFYNGNKFGLDGVGLAVADIEAEREETEGEGVK